MENKNYGEIFCQATEILAQHLIEQVSFDKTILCTIIDDSEKELGKYRVSNNEVTFDAYTSDTSYKKNDNVYVSIPGGDWNEQKIIISKKATNSELVVNYINPYDSFVNITNNIIITNSLTAGLTANDINKKQILLWGYNCDSDKIPSIKNNGQDYVGYNRLIISASFQTLLKSLDVKFGNYGLNLFIYTSSEDSEEENFKICKLDCSDMIGNPYNYDNYFTQTKVFNIENINKIVKMELWFFQQEGSFMNSQGEQIPYEGYPNNILIKDINISLGYDVSQFDNDALILYTSNSTKYDREAEQLEDNHKKIEVRWIHKFDDGTIKVVDEDDDIEYTLTFYKHTLGAKSHTVWSGVDWTVLSTQSSNNNNIEYIINDEEWNKYNEKTDSLIRVPSYNTTWMLPDVTKAEEKVKAILTYNDQVLYSTILTFSNVDEVISKATIDAVQALSIQCEDNSNGNYLVYRIDGDIIDNAYSKIKREFKACFNSMMEERDENNNPYLTEAESIEWIIPANNTMIKLYDDSIKPSNDGFYHIIEYGEQGTNKIDKKNNLYYTINSRYSQEKINNTIKCVVVRNKITYTAIKDLTFGPVGTSGTDYTFILDFVNNRENALTIWSDNELTTRSEKAVLVRARLYDYTGKELDIKDRKFQWNLINNKYVKTIEVIDENGVKQTDKIELQFDKNLEQVPDDNYTILETILEGWGDYPLKAYLPIPIRLSYDYQFISGATTIMYNSLGYLEDSFRNPYTIYKSDNQVAIIRDDWEINSGVGSNDSSIPKLYKTKEGVVLRPINIYVENAMSQLCVSGKDIINDTATIVWSQPIYVYQNKYPTSIVNDWNGELTIDNDKNAILAAKIVAGRKENDNSFTGVLMGDWGNTEEVDVENSLSKNTGIYGFQYGEASFGFKDDGTAFIGKAGKGRLEFNGEKSIIQSSIMDDSKIGMKMDFDDGYIQLVQFGENKNNQIWIDAQKDSIYPIKAGEKFKVEWDGTLTASNGNFTNGDFSGHIEANSGKIGAWTISNMIDNKGALYAQNTWFYPTGKIAIGEPTNIKFKVEPDGTLYAKDGDFEGNVIGDGFNFGEGIGYKYINNNDSEKINPQYVIKKKMGDYQGYTFNEEVNIEKDGKLGVHTGSDNIGSETIIFSLISKKIPMTVKSEEAQVLIQSQKNWVALCTTNWNKGRIQIHQDNNMDIIGNNISILGNDINISGKINITTSAENQTGIYARFA